MIMKHVILMILQAVKLKMKMNLINLTGKLQPLLIVTTLILKNKINNNPTHWIIDSGTVINLTNE